VHTAPAFLIVLIAFSFQTMMELVGHAYELAASEPSKLLVIENQLK